MKQMILTFALLMGAATSPAIAADEQQNCTRDIFTVQERASHDGKHFTVQMEGPAGPGITDIILIPGLASPREVWATTLAAQKACSRVHVVQIRGFGDAAQANAEGPVLESFVRELADYIADNIIANGGKKPALVGHSLGGLSALMVAARYPDLAGKVMVVDAVPFIGTIFNPAATVENIRPQAERMAAMIKAQYSQPKPIDTGKDPGERSQAGGMTNHAAGRIAVAKWTLGSDPRVVAQLLLDDMTTDMRPELPKITAPVTLLYAQDDRAMTPEQSTAAFVPQYAGTAKFNAVQITGSYHFIMLDQPEKFAAELTKFLDRDD
jgi:pimeloyl-ACP methyl ester carboxylesterase